MMVRSVRWGGGDSWHAIRGTNRPIGGNHTCNSSYICRQFFVSPKSLHGLDCSLVRYSKQKKSINWKKVSLRSTKRIQELIAPCFCVENCSGVLQKKRSNIKLKEVMVQKQGKYSTF